MTAPAAPLAPTSLDDTMVRRLVPVGTLPSAMRAALTAGAMVYDLLSGGRLDGGEAQFGESLFLVAGTVDLYLPDSPSIALTAGVGEACYALYSLSEAGAHLIAREDARLLQIDRKLLSTLLICVAASDELADQPWLPSVLGREPFSRLPSSGLYGLADALQRVQLEADEQVCSQFEAADCYYLLAAGRCAIEWQPDEAGDAVTLATVGPGDGFGEEALIADMRRTASVRTLEPSTLFRLTREALEQLMTSPGLRRIGRDEAEQRVADGAFWLDVRLPEEHAHNAPAGSINMPLGALRNGVDWLDPGNEWIVFCNAGRRSETAAAVLASRGFKVWLLEGGLFGTHPASGTADSGLGKLQEQRLQAEVDLEAALRESAAADTAAELQLRQADEAAAAQAETLRQSAAHAKERLTEALRNKLKLDTRWRNLEAEVRARHERAQAATLRLRNETEQRLRAEHERLSNEASEAARAMQNLRAERKQLEDSFAEELRALNERVQQARQQLEAKARTIREEMQRARETTAENLQRIRSEHGAAERQLAKDSDTRLAVERQRLREEISSCAKAQAEARADLEQVEKLRQQTARAAEEARLRAREELAAARARHEEELRREQERLAATARAAEHRLQEAERLREDALQRTHDGASRDDSDKPAALAHAESLEMELAAYQTQADGAARELEQAQAAGEAAQQARLDAETEAAQAQAHENELRLRLYEELEEALVNEHSQSEGSVPVSTEQGGRPGAVRPAEAVLASLDHRKHLRDEDAPLPESLVADIQELLHSDAGTDPLRARIVEQRTRLTEEAVAAAGEEKLRARQALERARQHLARLRQRSGEKDNST